MKIAIHYRKDSFSDRWISYCEKNRIAYKIVDAYSSDIVNQVSDCDAFMWHHHHTNPKDVLFARQLLFSLETAGKRVFPDSRTVWHFDDKVAQKYLLESIGAPLVPSYVYYDKKEAMAWADATSFPKVFKLRGGSGSSNVKLAWTKLDAFKYIRKVFGRGFSQSRFSDCIQEQYRKYKEGLISYMNFINYTVGLLFIRNSFGNAVHPEKGYAYFQDFIPQNDFDIRICIVDNKAFAIKRLCRKGDFRASGSGHISYAKTDIDERCVRIAFDVVQKLQCQSIGIDFIFDQGGSPLIVELSYGFTAAGYDKCEGYWDADMHWHGGSHFDFCGWMVENVIRNL